MIDLIRIGSRAQNRSSLPRRQSVGSMAGVAMKQSAWELRRGDETVGRLTLEGVDMPWYECGFEPSTGWPRVKPLMDAAQDAWDRYDEESGIEADKAIYALGLELVPEDGSEPIGDFLLRIEGGSARFRC